MILEEIPRLAHPARGKVLPVPLAENSASVKSKLLNAEIVGRVCESGLSQLRRYLPTGAPRKLTATDSHRYLYLCHRYRDYPRLSRLHRASLPVLPKGTASLVENHVCGESAAEQSRVAIAHESYTEISSPP